LIEYDSEIMEKFVELAESVIGAEVEEGNEVYKLEGENSVLGEILEIVDCYQEDEKYLVGKIENRIIKAHILKAQ
jgi:hypothetical protein